MELTLAQLQEMGSSGFPGLLGIDVYEAGDGFVRARLELNDKHQAPNGYLHAGAVIGVADTAAALSCSQGNVKSQTARGLDRLRGLLEAPTCDPAATDDVLTRSGLAPSSPTTRSSHV